MPQNILIMLFLLGLRTRRCWIWGREKGEGREGRVRIKGCPEVSGVDL